MKIVSRFEKEIKQGSGKPTPPSRIGNYSEGFIKNSNLKTNNMKTETITILALIGVMVTFGVIHYFKHKQLKRYYKRMVKQNNELMDTIVEKDERINQLSSQLTDMFQEDKRKNAKILAKNIEIQQLKEQAK